MNFVPRAVLAALKPGVSWREMHLLANRVVLEDLTAAGVLTGLLITKLFYLLGLSF